MSPPNTLIILTQTESLYAALTYQKVTFVFVESVQAAVLEIERNGPAFLLIDLEDTSKITQILEVLMNSRLNGVPFIIAAIGTPSSLRRADALNMGADMCITQPVDIVELLALINAVLRREVRLTQSRFGRLLPCIKHRDLFIDPLQRCVKMQGKDVGLTAKEFDILHLLASNPGRVLTKEEIYNHVWKYEYNGGANINDYICSLRKKLNIHVQDKDYIQTVFGVGYRFAVEDSN